MVSKDRKKKLKARDRYQERIANQTLEEKQQVNTLFVN